MMSTTNQINLILFSQHGMSDDNKDMASLAHKVAPTKSYVVAPKLDFLATYLDSKSLINQLENAAEQTLRCYPNIPARIIATSLGGVIWLEVLSRHTDWWKRFESLILLGSPVGGADLARIVDPFGWGIGIAKYLGQNHRVLAEEISASIPTLVIAGNITGGGDGVVPIESTKLRYAHFTQLDGVDHVALKSHTAVIKAIQEFWSEPRQPIPDPPDNLLTELIAYFRSVPGITDASQRDFSKSHVIYSFKNGVSIHTWTNLVGVDHIFIANQHGKCEYSGFVGWIHSADLQKAIDAMIRSFQ